MANRKLEHELEALEAALPWLRQSLPPEELRAQMERHSHEILQGIVDGTERAYAAGRIEAMRLAAGDSQPRSREPTPSPSPGLHPAPDR